MVRPVNLQDNFSKAPLASREQHIQQTRPEMAQRQLGQDQANEQVVNQSRPQPTQESGQAQLQASDQDGQPKQDQKQRRRKQGKEKEEDLSKAKPAADGEMHFFDVIA
jgi:hypothetical protein